MFIIDIFIYFLFAVILSFFARKSSEISRRTNALENGGFDKYLWAFVMFFTVIAAIRWNVGTDCISYIIGFNEGYGKSESKEYIWQWFVNFISHNNIHWSIGMGVVAFVQIYFIVKTVKNYPSVLIMLPFVMFGGKYWGDLMNGIRQMTVVCIFLWASTYIYKREFIKYLLFVAISVFIHTSAIILLPVYFISNKLQIEKHRMLLLVVFLGCFLFGLSPSFQSGIKYLQFITDLIGYDGYTERVALFLQGNYSEETRALGPMMLSYLFIPIFIIWFGPRLKEKYGVTIPYFSMWFNFAFLYACLFFLFCNTSHIFLRPISYFVLFQMVMASLLLYDLYDRFRKNSKIFLVFGFYSCVIFTNSAWNIFKANQETRIVAGETWESTTYKVFFMHREQLEKFGLK